MNVVFLFLTRQDINAIPRIKNWLNDMGKVENLVAFVNPHLAIDPSEEQVGLEDRIIQAVHSSIIASDDRISMELDLQKRWMQIPRDTLMAQMDKMFEPFGISTKVGLTVLNDSFQADRIPELLTKLRPAWPKEIPLGSYILVFPSQIPAPKPAGRPKGSVTNPAKRQAMLDNLARARAARKKSKETVAA